MKKILITGGAGFVGSNSTLFFAKNGWKIYLLDDLLRKGTKNNLSNIQKKIKLTFYKVDISNFNSVASIIKKIHFLLLFLIDDIKFFIKKIFNINFYYR